MVEASKDTQYSDLGYGDETRKRGDYVGLPHDQDESNGSSTAENDVKPGQAVSIDAQGNIKQAEDGENIVGVLVDYQRFGDSGGPDDPGSIKQDENATVKVGGTVKAEVAGADSSAPAVEAGDLLGIDTDDGTAGVLDGEASPETDFVALSGAVEDERYDGTQAYYAEVRLR